MDAKLKFNKEFVRDFWSLFKPYWCSQEKWLAITLLLLNLGCILLEVRAQVGLNNFNKDFYNALQAFDKPALFILTWHFAVIVSGIILSMSGSLYFQNLLSVRWRRWLTQNYLNRWLQNHNYYYMQFNNFKLDNPDQRLSEDLMEFSDNTLETFFVLVHVLITFVSFSCILWNLSGSLVIPLKGYRLILPGYLFWAAMFYSLIGMGIISFIGRKLPLMEYFQQKLNANFRFSLARLREYSEQIALFKGEHNENNRLEKTFSGIYNNFIKILVVRSNLTFLTSGYSTLAFVMGVVFALPIYFQKKLAFGSLMQIDSAFTSVTMAFAMIMNYYVLLANWRSVVSRLTEFNKFIKTLIKSNDTNIHINQIASQFLIVNNLTLLLPTKEKLISNIHLQFQMGNSYLITGKSGSGKTTLLRAIAGIWHHGSGEIIIPDTKMFFLPQKPYLPLGTLKGVLTYPEREFFTDENIKELLDVYKLDKYIEQLHDEKNWTQILSLGEQQKIAFIRAHLHKPKILFLDEATSALDEATEFHVYKTLLDHLAESIIVSIGHRKSLQQFHQHTINLDERSREIVTEEIMA